MELKDRFAARLQAARRFSEGLLKTFEKPEEWVFRVHPTANHATWIVGHVSHVDNSILKMLGSPAAVDKPQWPILFGPTSEVQEEASGYPPVDELLAFFRDRREQLLAYLAQQTNASLAERVPDGAPPIFSDVASVFEMISFHEGMHMGQLTVVRQALKHPRLIVFPRK